MSDNINPKIIPKLLIEKHNTPLSYKRKITQISPTSPIDEQREAKREYNKERCKKRRLDIKNDKQQELELLNNEEKIEIFFNNQWVDVSTLKVTELRAELKSRKANTMGNKNELINNLRDVIKIANNFVNLQTTPTLNRNQIYRNNMTPSQRDSEKLRSNNRQINKDHNKKTVSIKRKIMDIELAQIENERLDHLNKNRVNNNKKLLNTKP